MLLHVGRRVSAALDRFCRLFLFLAISAMTVVITLQIIFRVFFTALSWTEELSRYLLVWSSFIGAAVAFKKGAHISISFLVDRLAPRPQKIVRVLAFALMAAFFLVAIGYSALLIKLQVFQTSPAMGLKMRYVYTIMPISFTIMLIHLLCEFFGLWIPQPPKGS